MQELVLSVSSVDSVARSKLIFALQANGAPRIACGAMVVARVSHDRFHAVSKSCCSLEKEPYLQMHEL